MHLVEKGRRTLEAFEEAARRFREDLVRVAGTLEDIRNALMAEGLNLSPVAHPRRGDVDSERRARVLPLRPHKLRMADDPAE
jgi:hypothetical protein